MTGRQVARLWHQLMTKGLGHDHFVAHGSDLGAGVTAWLARDQPDAVAAIHLATPGLAVAPGPLTEQEDDFARAVQDWTAEEGGYMHEQSTKPATLAVGAEPRHVHLRRAQRRDTERHDREDVSNRPTSTR
jgi:pimeloyl-ACP methyl ester carboxylesterase